MTDMAALTQASRQARRARVETLALVRDGVIPVEDIISGAMVARDPITDKIKLRQLLLAIPGLGETAVARTLRVLARSLPSTPREPTIGWLCDPRVSGRRVVVFYNCLDDSRHGPWEGYPYAPPPPELDETARNWTPMEVA